METAMAPKQPWSGFMSPSETRPLQLQPQEISPTRPSPRKKLRESCNNCALSKVKCSKDQPSCVRCEDRGIYCHYSPSRRTGKRRASPSLRQPTAKATMSLGAITPPEEALSYEWHQDPGRAFTPDFLTPLGVSPFSRGVPESQVSHMHGESFVSWDDSFFSCGLDSPAFDYLGPPPGPGSYGTSSISDPALQDRPSDIVLPQGLESANPNLSTVTPTSISTPSSYSSRLKCNISPYDKNPGDQGQDCMKIALNILQGLHTPPSSCSFALPGNCSTSDRRASISSSINHVLLTNSVIIDSLTAILGCPCSLDAQLALVLTLIGSKIIAWCSAVAANDEVEPCAAVALDPNGNPLAASEYVLPLQMAAGKHYLRDADKGKMRAQLVLNEVHRVAGLVEQLVRRFSEIGTPCIDDGSFNAKAFSMSMCAELGAFLHKQVRELTKRSMEVLQKT